MGALGFRWGPVDLTGLVRTTPERALWRYRRRLPEFVWDAAQLEGNAFTYPEVQTLMEGVTVGGKKLHDEQQVLGLVESSRLLATLVETGMFALDKATSDALHLPVARNEALEAGHFRGEGSIMSDVRVALGELGEYVPPPTSSDLVGLHAAGRAELGDLPERALVYCLFACLQQFYFDGNRRTARLMMNGALMADGYEAVSVPATQRLAYNQAMARFYAGRDGTEMLTFFRDLSLDGR